MRDGFVQAEYLQLTGNEHINTYFKPDTNSKIIIDCQITDATFTSFTAIFGARNGNTNQFWIFTDSSTSGTEKWSARWCNTNTDYTINTSFTDRHTIILDKSSFVIDDKTISIPGTTFTSAYTLYLGDTNNANNTQYPCKLKIYSCKIYDNETLVRDYVPCLEDDGSNHIGLYDLVNDNFYRPFGTGNPILKINDIYGYIFTSNSGKSKDKVKIVSKYVNVDGTYKPIIDAYTFGHINYSNYFPDYIESNGNQYINTGVKPTGNTRVVVDFQIFNINSQQQAIFGSWSSGPICHLSLFTGDSISSIQADYNGNQSLNVWTNKIDGLDLTKRNVISVGNQLIINGTVIKTLEISSCSTNDPIYLFSCNKSNEPTYPATIRMYSCQIYEDNKLIRDFVPVKMAGGWFPKYMDNKLVGFYDKVGCKFYCNDFMPDDKISYASRSCIKTTYPGYDHNVNANWYAGNTIYSGSANLSIDDNGTITGTTSILMKPGESDAIKIGKYNYDNGYTEPYTNLKSSDCTLNSITITDSNGTVLITSNPSISVSEKHIMSFSVNAPILLAALPGQYILKISVTRNSSSNYYMSIPFTKITTEPRYFIANNIKSSFSLTNKDFSQSTYKYADGLYYTSSPTTYIHAKRIYRIPTCIEDGVTRQISVSADNITLGNDSGFYWYDSYGNFISGNIATNISGNTMTNIPPTNAMFFTFAIHDSNGITPDKISSVNVSTLIKNANEYIIESPIPDNDEHYMLLLRKICDIRSIVSKSYKAESLVPTWTITSKVSGASYGFNLASDGYYTSSNNGVNNSASVCRVNFTNNTGAAYTVTFNCINYAESNYDFGIIGKINTALSTSYDADSTYTKSFRGSSSSGVQTVTLSVPTGSSWVDIKYRKDSSQHSNNDSLKFKIAV